MSERILDRSKTKIQINVNSNSADENLDTGSNQNSLYHTSMLSSKKSKIRN